MEKSVTRRSFIKKSATLGAAAVAGSGFLAQTGCVGRPRKSALGPVSRDLAVAIGDDRYAMTEKAVELLGGMEAFVPRGAKVCILPNSQRNNPGTFTKPEIVRAVIAMCRKAGAKEVNCLSWLSRKSWDSTGLGAAVEEAGGRLVLVEMRNESLFKAVPVPRGEILKEARIMAPFFDHDVFINMPVTKDHAGNRFTGTMKNLMGLNAFAVNRTFHTGDFKNDDIAHLDQCIADLNTVIRPTLCVVDATEFIITNGPFGPGELFRPRKVVAGTDPVALDAYCASLWGLNPREIIMIDRALRHGLGEMDLAKRKITEREI